MNRLLQKKYVLFISLLLCNAMIFVLFAGLLHIQYEENDDILMCLIANGNFSGVPDYHLVFQNSIWGYFVSSLYRMLPGIEWYTVLFSIIHIGAMSIISYFLIRRHRDNLAFLGSTLICIYSIWMVTIQSFQFTTTAGILCIAGFLLFLRPNEIIWGGTCVLTSSLIRIEVVGLVGLLFIPLFVMTYGQQWKKYLHLLCLLLFVLIPIGLENNVFYQNEWKYYYIYNKVRGVINDNPNIDKIAMKDIPKIGITEQDYAMLCGFNPDPKVITLPVLKQISQRLNDIPIYYKLSNLKQLIKYRIPIVLLLLMILSMLFATTSRANKIIIMLWFCWMVLLLGALCLDHQLKNRVFICALLSMVVFYSMCSVKFSEKWNRVYLIICFCLIGLSGKYCYQCYKVRKIHMYKFELWQNNQLSLLKKLPKDAVIVALSSLAIEGMSPYHIKDFQYRLYPTGWLTNIPLFGDTGRSYASMTDKNVYIFTYSDSDLGSFKSYLKQNYNIIKTPISVINNKEYSVVQFR